MICETCGYWAVAFESVIDGHHPNCPELLREVSDSPPAVERVATPAEQVRKELDRFLKRGLFPK